MNPTTMKKFLFPFAFAALALGVSAQDGKPVGGNGPMISLDKDVHDYGTIAQGANGTCDFTVTNTGDAPLILTMCKGSCGCTVPECPKAPIKPGESAMITVKYDTKRVGQINKSVTISSNATNAPEKNIRIKGTVEASANTPASPVKEQSTMAPVERN